MWSVGCSGALFTTLNKEFDQPLDIEVRASSALSGGLMQAGRQCGMLWGSSMAASAESYRRISDPVQAMGLAIQTTRGLMDSYSERTACVNCRDFTRSDFSKPFDMLKYMLFRTRACFRLLYDWAPEAVESAKQGLQEVPAKSKVRTTNCASEVVREMGGTEKEMEMVAGFAGGMGLSGNGCGALGAAVWMKSLRFLKDENKKNAYFNPEAKNTMRVFNEKTGSEFRCHKICGKRFDTLEEHSEFIRDGGCKELIEALAKS
jgi:C_GCAxxG_C_C family probable redox protein